MYTGYTMHEWSDDNYNNKLHSNNITPSCACVCEGKFAVKPIGNENWTIKLKTEQRKIDETKNEKVVEKQT